LLSGSNGHHSASPYALCDALSSGYGAAKAEYGRICPIFGMFAIAVRSIVEVTRVCAPPRRPEWR